MNNKKLFMIINEEIRFILKKNKLNESIDILGLRDVAEYLARTGFAELDMIYGWIVDAFKKNGDDGVKQFYKQFTKGDAGNLDNISKGKYVIKHETPKYVGRNKKYYGEP